MNKQALWKNVKCVNDQAKIIKNRTVLILAMVQRMEAPLPNLVAGMKIFEIFVDISTIYPISVMFDTISSMTDIS